MADVVEIAKRKRAELSRELERLNAFILTATELLGEDEPSKALKLQDNHPTVRINKTSVVVKTIQAASDVIKRAGTPLSSAKLLEEVVKAGIEVGGKIPTSTLSARLSNSGTLENHRGIGWWFKDRPLPRPYNKSESTDLKQVEPRDESPGFNEV